MTAIHIKLRAKTSAKMVILDQWAMMGAGICTAAKFASIEGSKQIHTLQQGSETFAGLANK